MKAKRHVDSNHARREEIAELIRDSYPEIRAILPPYVDGTEVYHALLSLGHDIATDGPEIVGEALGWRCMELPAANLNGKPKHYLPHAVRQEKAGTKLESLTEQLEACAKEMRAGFSL